MHCRAEQRDGLERKVLICYPVCYWKETTVSPTFKWSLCLHFQQLLYITPVSGRAPGRQNTRVCGEL